MTPPRKIVESVSTPEQNGNIASRHRAESVAFKDGYEQCRKDILAVVNTTLLFSTDLAAIRRAVKKPDGKRQND